MEKVTVSEESLDDCRLRSWLLKLAGQVGCLVLVGVFFFNGLQENSLMDRALTRAASPLMQASRDYIDDNEGTAFGAFAGTSVAKGILAVIEGSDIGVSLGVHGALEAGDIVQPVYDVVDFVWRVLLACIFALILLDKLLIVSGALDGLALSVALGLLLFYLPVRFWGNRNGTLGEFLKAGVRAALLLSLFFYLVLPGAIAASRFVSERTTTEFLVQNLQSYEATLLELQVDADAADGEDDEGLVAQLKRVAAYCQAKLEYLFGCGLTICVGFLMNTILFPLGFAWLLFALARGLFRKVVSGRMREQAAVDFRGFTGRMKRSQLKTRAEKSEKGT